MTKLTSPGVPRYESTEYHPPVDTRQVTVDALEQAARICDMVPEGRPKASFSGAIRAFIKGRYSEVTPASHDSLSSVIVWAEELLSAIDIPEKNCSCHISPPCGDCEQFWNLREITKHLQDAIKDHRGY